MANVQSVERALAVLRCLGGGPAGVSQIAERVGLPKSTVSRLLATLQELGAVVQLGPGGDYRVGEVMVEIAAGARTGGNLVAVARPHLTELVALVGEDAGLSVLDEGLVCYLDQVSADAPVRLHDWTGATIPPHCVSSGLVLLAGLPPAELDAVLARPLRRFTPRTVVAVGPLRRRLADVARLGHAWVHGEYADDITSVAAPVRDGSGSVLAAVHVHGPSYRFPGDADRDVVAGHVVAAGRRIGERLGHRGVSAVAG